jgi:RNA polymerase sigma-70 factor (sigma-E family)
LDTFIRTRGDILLREAWLLTGSRDSGEELLQEALVRLLRRWDKIKGDPEGYLRRILYNLAVDRWRWRAKRREILTADLQDRCAGGDQGGSFPSGLVDALALLPRHQRAVLVLRFFADETEAQTAAALGCSIGAVKSASSRGLARLRELTQNAGTEETPRILQESFTD